MKLFLVMHHHRHGVDAFLIMAEKEPEIDDLVKACDLDYEPIREDENLEISEVDFIRVIEKDKVVTQMDVVSDACLHAEIVRMQQDAERNEGHFRAALDPGIKEALSKQGQISMVESAGIYSGIHKACSMLLRKCSCGIWRKI